MKKKRVKLIIKPSEF